MLGDGMSDSIGSFLRSLSVISDEMLNECRININIEYVSRNQGRHNEINELSEKKELWGPLPDDKNGEVHMWIVTYGPGNDGCSLSLYRPACSDFSLWEFEDMIPISKMIHAGAAKICIECKTV